MYSTFDDLPSYRHIYISAKSKTTHNIDNSSYNYKCIYKSISLLVGGKSSRNPKFRWRIWRKNSFVDDLSRIRLLRIKKTKKCYFLIKFIFISICYNTFQIHIDVITRVEIKNVIRTNFSQKVSDLDRLKFDLLRRTLGEKNSSYSRILCFSALNRLIFSRCLSGFKRTQWNASFNCTCAE